MKRFLLTFFLTSGIWSVALADSTTFAYTFLDDTYIYQSEQGYNFGGSTELRASLTRSILVRLYCDLTDHIGTNQIIDNMRIYLYLWARESGTGVSDTFQVYGMQKGICWGEGTGNGGSNATSGATYSDWNMPTSEWGTAGLAAANDDSLFNCGDASGYDRWATPSDTPLITGTGTSGWKYCTVHPDYVQTCYDSSRMVSVLIRQQAATASKFYSTENVNYQPYIVVYHHTSEEEPPEQPTGGRVMIH